MWCVVATATASLHLGVAGSDKVRPLSTQRHASAEELTAMLPAQALFGSPEELEHHCLTASFRDSTGLESRLEDLRGYVDSFYDSGAPLLGEVPMVRAVFHQRRLVAEACPLAVMQVLLLTIEARLLSVFTTSALAREQHLAAFAEASVLHTEFTALEHWTAHAVGGTVPHFAWPIKRGWGRALRYYDLLWKDVHDSEDAWAVMEQPGEISDELYHDAFSQVASVLLAMGLEWWPCRGTLIALLRHGRRAGRLSRGVIDEVERDIDIMLGVPSEAMWQTLSKEIETRLMDLGWDKCWTKTSVESDSPLRDVARRDLLYCIRMAPAYMLVDISSYITGGSGPEVFIHRMCRGRAIDGTEDAAVVDETCTVLEDVGPLRHNGGILAKDAIRPLARCRANGLSIPCPHKPLETIAAMIHSGLDIGCIALPTTKGRDPDSPWTKRQAEAGLCAEDVRILRERSARLHALGFQSMLPYFDSCSSLAELSGASCT